jgi:hypothetical protein
VSRLLGEFSFTHFLSSGGKPESNAQQLPPMDPPFRGGDALFRARRRPSRRPCFTIRRTRPSLPRVGDRRK